MSDEDILLLIILAVGIIIFGIVCYTKIKENIATKITENKKIEKYISDKEKELTNIINEQKQSYPYLAEILSNWEHKHDLEIAEILRTKARPAYKASETVKKISIEKRQIELEMWECKHQLLMYESLFPWLEDFKELDPREAIKYSEQYNENGEYDTAKVWLSPEEYIKLSEGEKWQIALDRYINRKNKTNWHIGIEYERYIGYLYEEKGYDVRYEGALMGLEDRGRDIIAKKGKETLVIQCKRWSKEKVIHEKHIMQLFGSVAVLDMENRKKHKGIFYTSTILSPTARYFAEKLDIEVYENFDLEDYPMIKCNISNGGEKIYHLPFDQQYDKINMHRKKGNKYVVTVAEAEKMGFRHAYRWQGNNN